ncbi:hypothetical protein FisN_18Lh303 [Fistulifera solaris]|uniref:Uncharacterized protein n=1 Tax=Fistulifera solaris TaxID=1519565 RepID=A0A1Z5JUX0_FISSO|nr:hypothetical protein FisN_18Lh303 [Fistulifera solaris]|eukprot:GAX17642.1 hypothetical protein FisN_18Lh303 [Fistulifera solaris]
MHLSSSLFTALSLLCLSGPSGVQSWTNYSLHSIITRQARQSSFPPLSAGFGASSDKKKEGKTATPLKPKQQWDRYLALKRAPRVMVGVQIQDTDDWLPVGSVKAKDTAALEAAVLRQRALIAEHAKRLFPLQVTAKTKLNWGMMITEKGRDEGSWKTLDPKSFTSADVLDKDIGFEGTPDAASGFYCVYDQGKILNASGSGTEQRSPAFKKK